MLQNASEKVRAFSLDPSTFQASARGYDRQVRRRMGRQVSRRFDDDAIQKWAKTYVTIIHAQNC